MELNGELWRAETRLKDDPIESGTRVEVKERVGLTLIVEQAGDEA